MNSDAVDSVSEPAEPVITHDGVTYHFFAADGTIRPKESNPSEGAPGQERSVERQGANHPPAEPTTTSLPPTAKPTPQTSTTSTPPSTAEASTSTTSTAPSDDDRSDDGAAPKSTGSVSKPPVEAAVDPGPISPPDSPTVDDERSNPAATPPATAGEPNQDESTRSSNRTATTRAAVDWTFLAGEADVHPAQLEPVESPDPESDTSTVVLSWLVERSSMGTSMAVLSPLVVLLTIWDAAASAGSGLAAPASGLGTFVLLVLFERGHLASAAGLLRRRGEL